ncbi:MAG TPA: tripartite tricarboxylate transporter substrate-binding protein [Burkholderiales bacterium]|nr:tripartite tricarboxylate transporter substrate-binding protein [Burkholderiales bacterium]
MKRVVLALLLAAALPAAAQFPSKPVRLVNPFTAGGPLDIMARLLTERLTTTLGRPVLVENKPGAAGSVGAAEVARATPDGHTVLLTLFSIVTSNPHLYDKLPFDPLKDFAPVVALARSDSVVVVHPSVPAQTMRDLVAYAKANPGKVNYASAGKASPGHLTAEYFVRQAGVELTHVPYKGNAEAIRSVLAGETQIMFTPTTGALPLVQGGKLKALGVYLTDGIAELPNVSTLESQGFAGFDQKSLPFWYGLVVPAGTPREAIDRLNLETNKVLKDPQVVTRLDAARIFPIGGTPEEFGAMMRAGHAAWGKVIRETGVKGE